jgi:hypothetical protein
VKLKRLSPHGREQQRSTSLAEPSEARFRSWILALVLLLGPPLLLFFYYRTMFPGLTNPDALDFAQLGRNLTMGRGFSTSILRPLALSPENIPLHPPDVTHGPLYPLLLGLAFGVLGAKDTVAAGVSGIFYLLTIPVLYLLSVRLFNRAVGLITMAIFIFNALMLEYAISGLHITLYIFLTTCLLLAIHRIAVTTQDNPGAGGTRLPRGAQAMAGTLAALLYLTDPIFFWILPVIVFVIVKLSPAHKPQAALNCLLPMLLLTLPWMLRNATLTGNPIFGLRGYELWMSTPQYYPGDIAYRMTEQELIRSVGLFKAIVQKILLGAGQVVQAFPQVTASWVLAFFLPCLLFRFTDPAVNSVRRTMMYCFFGIFVGMALFYIKMTLFVSFIPTMLIFSVAYLRHLMQQAQLPRTSVVFTSALITVAVCLPLLSEMFLVDRTPRLPAANSVRSLETISKAKDLCLSDQPWIVAWYADRSCLWIPVTDKKIGDFGKELGGVRWLFLTERSQQLSLAWQQIYGTFRKWNMDYAQAKRNNRPEPSALAIQGKGHPLIEILSGFTAYEPIKNAEAGTVLMGRPSN